MLEAFQQFPVFYLLTVGLLGLFVGSFLNVVIYRLPIMMENDWRRGWQQFAAETELQALAEKTDKTENTGAGNQNGHAGALQSENDNSVAVTDEQEEKFNLSVPRSRCPGCGELIRAWQNIPVISYLLLRGKCAGCKTSISVRYPLVELLTALLSVICAWHFGVTLQAAAALVITWSLIALSGIDFDTQLLPDSITLPLMWLGLIASLVPVFVGATDAIVGAAAGYLSLWSVYWIFKLLTGKEGMGYGDFKLLAALGAWFGWQALPMIILLSSLMGAIVGVTLIVAKGRDKQIPIPFGPYLAAAGWLAMIFGTQLTSWYMGIYA